MEYEFRNDPVTGNATAKFSLEHEVFGPWIEVEVGHDIQKMTRLLDAINLVKSRQESEVIVIGSEYNAVISEEDITIQTNASVDGFEVLSEQLTEDGIDFDQNCQGTCGLEDFKLLLTSWGHFIN